MKLDVSSLKQPAVMGILNVTPDSFSDGGRFAARDDALRQAERMLAEGVDILDIGGESTRPGAADVNVQQELDRVVPVIEALVGVTDKPVSIDTSKAGVMRAAVHAGAGMINDVRALREDGALEAAAELGAAVCLMHMQGQPRTMQRAPDYADVTAEVTQFLGDRVEACTSAGIPREDLVVDPGFGFGKSVADNVELLGNLRQLQTLGLPILAGLSRKSTLGELTGRGVNERMPASVAAAVIAVTNGARIVRVHDVAETVDALTVLAAVMNAGS